jgi:hypothetical protein
MASRNFNRLSSNKPDWTKFSEVETIRFITAREKKNSTNEIRPSQIGFKMSPNARTKHRVTGTLAAACLDNGANQLRPGGH